MTSNSLPSTVLEYIDEGRRFLSRHTVLIARLFLLSMYFSDAFRTITYAGSAIIKGDVLPGGFHEFIGMVEDFAQVIAIVPAFLILLHNEKFGRNACFCLIGVQLVGVLSSASHLSFTALIIPLGHAGCVGLLMVENHISLERKKLAMSGLPDADDKRKNSDWFILVARTLVTGLYSMLLYVVITFSDNSVVYWFGGISIALSAVMLLIGYKTRYTTMYASFMLVLVASMILFYLGAFLNIMDLARLVTSVLSVIGGLLVLGYMGAGRLSLDQLKKSN